MTNKLQRFVTEASKFAGGRNSLATNLGVTQAALVAVEENGVSHNPLLALRLVRSLIPSFAHDLAAVLQNPELLERAIAAYVGMDD